MTTSIPLHVLILEDNPADAELMLYALRQDGFSPDSQCIETEAEYLAQLDPSLDLILADYNMPQFDALRALDLLQERGLDIPLIVVSGSIGEDLAVAALKRGAVDYLLKDRLARLGEAVRHALLQRQLRDARRQSEQALRASEERFRALIEDGSDIIAVVDAATTIHYISPSIERVLGYVPQELMGKNGLEFVHPDDKQSALAGLSQLFGPQAVFVPRELRVRHKDGSLRTVELTSRNLLDNPGVQGIVVNFRDITARKLAEEALVEERNLLRTLIDSLPDAVYVKDSQGRLVLDNIQNRRNLGVVAKPPETIGKTDFDFLPRELAEQFYADEQTVIQSGQALIDHEEPNIDRQGKRRWHLTSKVPLRDQAGRIIGLVGISRDITERKRTEEDLRKSEAAEHEQRVLADALRDSTIALTSSLEPEVVMTRILDNLGRVIPHEAANIMLIEGEAVRIAFWRGYTSLDDSYFKTFRMPLGTANLRHMLTTRSPLFIADTHSDPGWQSQPEFAWIRSYAGAPIQIHGQVIGILTIDSSEPGYFTQRHADKLKDFADQAAIALENAQLYDELRQHAAQLEHRVAERTAELSQAKEHSEAIFNSTSDAIVVTGLDGLIVQKNPSFSNLFGYWASEAIRQPFTALAAPKSVEALTDAWREVIAAAHPNRIEITAHRKDGTPFDAEVVLSPIIGPDEKTSGVVCGVGDISVRKRVEEELQELNQLKSEFLSTAAHELRTPLTSIRGFSEILLTRQLDADRQKRYLTLISEQATQLGKLIDDLLNISKIEAERSLSLTLEPINMAELVNEVIAPFREFSSSHHIQVEAPPQYPPIMGDPIRLAEVVKNLLSNAIKYSPQGGTIAVQIRRLPDHFQVSVQDEGIGMTPEQQAHLFEKFYRADASNTAITGTGLGLAICKLIIEMHRGEILAESKRGVGTTIRFTLPLPVG